MKTKLVVVPAIAAALALLSLHPASLYAQGRGRAMGACPGCMHHGAGAGPETALAHGEQLALSPEQEAALEVLAAQAREERATRSTEMQSAHDRIVAATESERFDEVALRRALDAMADVHADAALARLRAEHATRQVLTADQEDQLRTLVPVRGMRGRMGACPMMDGESGSAPPPR